MQPGWRSGTGARFVSETRGEGLRPPLRHSVVLWGPGYAVLTSAFGGTMTFMVVVFPLFTR
jgi:hypothetical protein